MSKKYWACRSLAMLILIGGLAGCGGRPPIPAEYTVSGQPLEYWVDALADPKPEVRARAVRALGNVGPEVPEIVPALTTALTDSDPAIRIQAATILMRFGPAAKEAIPALTEAQSDRDENVRKVMTQALEKIESGS